jgi:peptidoglycan/xylan/chitin deacetylase (PgdA/CDA1 family)
MIHEFHEWMFQIPLHEYTLTFDDGLYSQYMFFDKLKEINTRKIFFISTNIVADESIDQSNDIIKCDVAHELYFNNNDTSHYMKWSQIQNIAATSQCEIGGHSHNHKRDPGFSVIADTRLMKHTFDKHNLKPRAFCFPYNDESYIYKLILNNHGFSEFFSKDRVDIYDL